MTPLLWLALLGMQAAAVESIDQAAADGIAAGVYPGAVVVVGTGHRVLLARGYGHFTWDRASSVPDPDSSLFDLASLTKVVAATPAAMALVDDGLLDLDRPVQSYLPGFLGSEKEQVTVRHLLEHRSGLRAFLPLNERARDAAEARALVLSEPLLYPPGTRVEYSDLNAMLLGWVVEAASGQPLDGFVDRRVLQPAGMSETRYLPARALRSRIVPVGLWRGHAISGEVHDQNAARLGGVSGHAGLYSTGSDLARYAQLLLNGGLAADSVRVLSAGVVRHFTRRGPGNRALGWEMRNPDDGASAGSLLSLSAFGHGGFTGTSIWIDPERDLFVIVLTNRVFSPRTGRSITRLKEIRARIADAAVALRNEVCRSAAGTSASC
ncbi:MAG: beta-lactamase family protein [Gemmatimonadales bacterium]|nr:beta-lactamase family protein [Gemmatimonadales bacterium]